MNRLIGSKLLQRGLFSTGKQNYSFNGIFKVPFNDIRSFSSKIGGDGSDPDFQASSKVKASASNEQEELQNFLKNAVSNHDVLLFMKGSPNAPQCGFSAKVSQMLKKHNVDFSSADVLSSPEVREGIKKFSNWPTIPQLYVKGEFIGGCDIVTDMEDSGELEELLKPIAEKQKEETKQ